MQNNMFKKWFITGTDTNIGKTTVSIVLLNQAKKLGFKTVGYKPISSGCITKFNYCYNCDVALLEKYSTEKFSHNIINPYSFYDFDAPNILFHKSNQMIDCINLSYGLNIIQQHANYIIIEGVGGFDTPVMKSNILLQWIRQKNIPVILVIGMKLGCINHSILTYKSIIQSQVKFSGWYTNDINYKIQNHINYIQTIKKFIQAPYLGHIPFLGKKYDINNININIQTPL